jgi:hypothetical protein
MSDEVQVTVEEQNKVEGQEVQDTAEKIPEGQDTTEPKAEEVPKVEKEEPKKQLHDDRRWNRLLQERATYKAQLDMLLQQQQQTQPKAETRPSRADYANDEDYVDALTEFKVQQKLAPMAEQMQKRVEQTRIANEWQGKLVQAKSDYPDFESALEEAQDIPIQPHVSEALMDSALGADIAYYLAKNPEEAYRINGMSPTQAIREIGRIESYVEFDKKEKSKAPKAKVSAAPAPIKPPRSSGGGSTKSLEDMSPAEYIAYRNKQGKR